MHLSLSLVLNWCIIIELAIRNTTAYFLVHSVDVCTALTNMTYEKAQNFLGFSLSVME